MLTATDAVLVYWMDRAWTIQGEGNLPYAPGYPEFTVRSLATGQPILSLTGGSGSIPSGDGTRIIVPSCPGSQLSFETYLLASSDAGILSPTTATGCSSGGMVATSSGDAVLYPVVTSGAGELYRADLVTGALTTIVAHKDSPTARNSDHLAISLSSTEHTVDTVGRDSVLRLWSYPGLEKVGMDIPTSWTREYQECYCTPRSFAPMAWSSDDVLLATGDLDGNTVLRRGCDGAVVTTLPAPALAMRPDAGPALGADTWGPVFLAVGPGDQTLAVFYEGSLAMYRVRRR
jgi:WD40 repeat protein